MYIYIYIYTYIYTHIYIYIVNQLISAGKNVVCIPRSVMVKVNDCELLVTEFELQWHYYVHFGERLTPLISLVMG